jgi:hypothetical protein
MNMVIKTMNGSENNNQIKYQSSIKLSFHKIILTNMTVRIGRNRDSACKGK